MHPKHTGSALAWPSLKDNEKWRCGQMTI